MQYVWEGGGGAIIWRVGNRHYHLELLPAERSKIVEQTISHLKHERYMANAGLVEIAKRVNE